MADKIQGISPGASASLNTVTRQGAEVLRHSAQTVQQGGLATSDAVRRAGDATAEAMQRNSTVGAAAMQRAGQAVGETMRQGAQAIAGTQRQFTEKAAEQIEEMGRKVAQTAKSAAPDMRAMMALPDVATGGMKDMQQSMAGLMEGVVRTNLRATQELMQLANPGAYIEFQQRFMRDYMDTLMQGTASLLVAARRTTDAALRTTEQQIEQRQHSAPSLRAVAE